MGLLEIALGLLGLLVGGGALLIALLALFASYDDLVRKLIYYAYDPKIEVTLQDAGPETEKQFHITDAGFQPTYSDHFRIDYHKFENKVTAADGGGMIRTFNFSVHVDAYDDKRAMTQLRVLADRMIYMNYDETARDDVEDGYEKIRKGEKTEYVFRESELSRAEPYWFDPSFEVQMPPEGDYREFEVEAELDVTIDASEFEIPGLGRNLPTTIGEVEFESIERQWTIIGPDHPEFGS